MKKHFALTAGLLFVATVVFAQAPTLPAKPKLVVGIVVDQMRWDYLYRYAEKYSSGGFKRLLNEGYSCANTHINYFPSYTACGHACVYTGSVPAIHGIAGNFWYNRDLNRETASVEDTTATRVGEGKLNGNVSPRNLLVTTIGDEIHLADNFRSKVISLALKDRSAILPGGHTANGAYFLDGATGNFITTSYYMKSLPDWVNQFNNRKLVDHYLTDNWNTLLPLAAYTESSNDDEPFEHPFSHESKPVFSHQLIEQGKVNKDIIALTPFGNSLTLEFAKAAIAGEQLGKNNSTDLLAVSISSTDLIGHQFGPNSIEVEDCYLRLDKELSSFFSYLDQTVGKGNYVVFLTADHGAANAADYSTLNHIPGGSFNIDSATRELNTYLSTIFGPGEWILSHENMQLYINQKLAVEKGVQRHQLFEVCREFLMKYEAITNVVDLTELATTTLPNDIKLRFTNGYNCQRSGNFQILYQPAWMEGFKQGTTHGSVYPYDTHIPLVWMGWKIKHGESFEATSMTDIAPTLAAMLHVQEPNGNVGKVITAIIRQ